MISVKYPALNSFMNMVDSAENSIARNYVMESENTTELRAGQWKSVTTIK
jgi:hypothetical protein